MATKPAAKAAAAKPAAKAKGTAVVRWDEALAARAALAKKAEAAVGTGNFISMKSGQMSYQGNAVPGNSLDAVVLSSILENNYFVGKYDPNVAASPVCFAFGTDDENMKPHPKSLHPQNPKCGIAGQPGCCPHNEWDSGENNSGKACKNVRRLGLITADMAVTPEKIADATVAYLKTPVTSVKAWAGFVNGCAAQEKPPLAYITAISTAPDAKTQFKVSFRAKEEITDGKIIGALLEKADAVDKLIDFPYQPIEPAAAAPRGKRGAKPVPAKGRGKKY